MKRYPLTIILTLLLMCFTQLQAQHNSQAHFYKTEGVEVEKWSETGWVDLFNGKDLTGWKTTGNWIVKDGVVTLHPRKGEHGWQRYDAYLTSEKVSFKSIRIKEIK